MSTGRLLSFQRVASSLVVAGALAAIIGAAWANAGPSGVRALSYAFVDHRDGQLWKQNADGSGRTRLSSGTAVVASAAWSPQGDRLVLERHSQNGNNTYVEVLNSDGSHWLRLGQGEEPTWSPDGRRVAFVRKVANRFGERTDEVFVVKTDGTGVRRVTNLAAVPGDLGARTSARLVTDTPSALAWAPGRTILFELLTRGDGGNLRAVDPTTGRIVKLTHSRFASYAPVWSPDGRKIVFLRDSADQLVTEVHVMDGDGSRERRLSTGFQDLFPSWSPDGAWILFSRVDGDALVAGTAGPDIYVMRADGSEKRRLTHDPANDDQPQWLPDGRISFLRSSNGRERVMIMHADGGSVTALGRPDSHIEPIWRPVRS